MNLVEDNLDLKKMYKYQTGEIDSDKEYNEYLNYLSIFYKKDTKKEKYNKEYTNFKIANILCSGAFYLNLPNKNLCVHHSNVEFIIEESVLEEIYKNLTEDDFIDIIKLLDISPHECGIRFSAKEKINVVSLTANDITTNYKK